MNAQMIGLALATMLAAGTTWGQPEVDWERTYDADRNLRLWDAIQKEDGGFLLVGAINRPDGMLDGWLQSCDSNGDSLWSCRYGGPGSQELFAAIQTEDQGYFIAGYIKSNRGANRNGWIVRIDESGDSLWSTRFEFEGFSQFTSIAKFNDSVYVLSGLIDTLGYRSLLYWINLDGERIVEIISPENGLSGTAIGTREGGVAWAYTSGSCFPYDIRLTNVNEDHQVVWTSEFDFETDNHFGDLAQCNDGGYILTGYSDNEETCDALLIRVDSLGEQLWMNSIDEGLEEFGGSIRQTPDGSFILCGNSATRNNDLIYPNGWLVRVNPVGESIWSIRLNDDQADYLQSIFFMPDGGYLIAGRLAGNFLLLKTTPDPASVRDPVSIAPGTLHLAPPYPNPFNSSVRLSYQTSGDAYPTRLAIFDPLGRRIADLTDGKWKRENGKGYSVVWNAADVPAGEYFVNLSTPQGTLSRSVTLIK